MQNQGFDLHIFSDLLNTGETPGQKVPPPRSFEPELSLRLVQSSFANIRLVKSNHGEISSEKCMAFCTRLENVPSADNSFLRYFDVV